MSPILIEDGKTVQHEAVDGHATEDVHKPSSLQRTEHIEQKLAAAVLTALDELMIAAQADKPRCARYDDAQVFPITAINVLSGRDQIRYMRLLRGIARAVGVPPFGSVSVLLANDIVYTAAQLQQHSILTCLKAFEAMIRALMTLCGCLTSPSSRA